MLIAVLSCEEQFEMPGMETPCCVAGCQVRLIISSPRWLEPGEELCCE